MPYTFPGLALCTEEYYSISGEPARENVDSDVQLSTAVIVPNSSSLASGSNAVHASAYIESVEPPVEIHTRKRSCSVRKRNRPRSVRPLRPHASEDVWNHRIQHRKNSVAAIKATEEYVIFDEERSDPNFSYFEALPTTPEPMNRQLSKRDFESQIMNWRRNLRQWKTKDESLRFPRTST